MPIAYTVYLNGHYFDSLASPEDVGDRPEPYRQHEKALWTIYQLLRLGEHEAVITDLAKQPKLCTGSAQELKQWVAATYPGFVDQLDQPVHTRFPHPGDRL